MRRSKTSLTEFSPFPPESWHTNPQKRHCTQRAVHTPKNAYKRYIIHTPFLSFSNWSPPTIFRLAFSLSNSLFFFLSTSPLSVRTPQEELWGRPLLWYMWLARRTSARSQTLSTYLEIYDVDAHIHRQSKNACERHKYVSLFCLFTRTCTYRLATGRSVYV